MTCQVCSDVDEQLRFACKAMQSVQIDLQIDLPIDLPIAEQPR